MGIFYFLFKNLVGLLGNIVELKYGIRYRIKNVFIFFFLNL